MSRIGKISMLPGPVGGLLLMAMAGRAVSPAVVTPSASTPAIAVRERPPILLRRGGPPFLLEAASTARASSLPRLLGLMSIPLDRCWRVGPRSRPTPRGITLEQRREPVVKP